MWDLNLYQRLARADAWAIIGPVWWYGPSTNLKTMFDRLAEALAAFDAWVGGFVKHVTDKGLVPGTAEAERGAKSTTNV
jgi:multimeric flavodoxin WrbA